MAKYIETSTEIKNEILNVLNSDLHTLIKILPDDIEFILNVNNIGGIYGNGITMSGNNFMYQLKRYLFNKQSLPAEIKNYKILYKPGYIESFDFLTDESYLINVQGNIRGAKSLRDFNKPYSVLQIDDNILKKDIIAHVEVPKKGVDIDEFIHLIKRYDKELPIYKGLTEIKLSDESRYKTFDVIEYQNPFRYLNKVYIYLTLDFYKYRTLSMKGLDSYNKGVSDYYASKINGGYSGD